MNEYEGRKHTELLEEFKQFHARYQQVDMSSIGLLPTDVVKWLALSSLLLKFYQDAVEQLEELDDDGSSARS